MKKSLLATALVAAMGVTSANAATVGIAEMTIDTGTFAMGVFTPAPNPFVGNGTKNITVADAQDHDPAVAQSACASDVACFDFNDGGVWVNYNMTTGASGTFDDAGGVITVDLSGFQANWNTTDFAQGNSSVTGTVDAAGNYDISWFSPISGGPFDGQTGTYTMQGTVSAVPVPAAAWLMGSGLLGLVGVARRRKA